MPSQSAPGIADLDVRSGALAADAYVLVRPSGGPAERRAETDFVASADTIQIPYPIPSATNATYVVCSHNRTIGTVLGALAWTTAGTCSVAIQIANADGTSATNITGLSALSASASVPSDHTAATAANTMTKTGATATRLQIVVTSASSLGDLQVEIIARRT